MKKTTLICTLILVSLLSGCAGNNASQPVSSPDTSVTSSASESTTESITTPETSVPEDATSSYEDEKFTAIGVVDSSAEESKRDIASFIYDYGSEYKTPGKTTIDKMFSEALGDKIIDDEQGDEGYTMLQFTRFLDVLAELENKYHRQFAIRHCAASAAVLHLSLIHI